MKVENTHTMPTHKMTVKGHELSMYISKLYARDYVRDFAIFIEKNTQAVSSMDIFNR